MRVPALVLAALISLTASPGSQSPPPAPPLDLFFSATSFDDDKARAALDELARHWRDAYTPMLVDLARLMPPAPRRGGGGPDFTAGPDEDGSPLAGRGGGIEAVEPVRRESLVRLRLVRFLERQTGQRFGDDLPRWREWMWTLPDEPHPDYAAFKGFVYSQIDPVMRRFFPPGVPSRVRLDEIDWGGVRVNGIPPLVHPKVIKAAEADYLKDGHVIFGVVVNGEARAYPKRILAWHEMAIDRIGGVEMTTVYCTLCGTVIPYESAAGGRLHRFGTSGLLYRSNKLMFDEQTMSLWSAIEGRPVVGPLTSDGLQLTAHASVTTTWGEWRALHPDTTVLSLDTGFERDYREGAAYRDYFATDDLYFRVPHVDRRLRNKAEVVVFRMSAEGGREQPVAIAADFLARHAVYELGAEGRRYLIVTSRRGANRVYDITAANTSFSPSSRPVSSVIDSRGRRWRTTEEALVLEGREGADAQRLPRVVAQRAFWFGWYAQFPDTLLVK